MSSKQAENGQYFRDCETANYTINSITMCVQYRSNISLLIVDALLDRILYFKCAYAGTNCNL